MCLCPLRQSLKGPTLFSAALHLLAGEIFHPFIFLRCFFPLSLSEWSYMILTQQQWNVGVAPLPAFCELITQ